MATREYTVENLIGGIKVVTWTGLLNGDVGKPFVSPQFADKCVQTEGDFGVGGACEIEGTNYTTPGNYRTLNDPQGNPLSVLTPKVEQILENPYQLRPRVSSGDGTTDLTVKLLVSTPTAYDLFIPNSA